MEKKVSIIIPIYNQERYLDYSIPSVINQTWKNIEIICVNDGSTDLSQNIITRYQKIDSRIKVIEKRNGGLVDATIAGIEIATGEYICFLDPDDVIGTDFIKSFMLNIGFYDFVAMGVYERNATGIFPRPLREDLRLSKSDIDLLKNRFLYDGNYSGVSNSISISRWNKLYKKELILEILDEFKKCKNITLGEDTIFTYLILCKATSGCVFSEPNSYIYNVANVNSMMKNGAAVAHIEKARIAADKLSELIQKYGGDVRQAACLYYFLVSSLRQRMLNSKSREFEKAYVMLHHDKYYRDGYKIVCRGEKIVRKMLWFMPNQSLYSNVHSLGKKLKTDLVQKKNLISIYVHCIFWYLKRHNNRYGIKSKLRRANASRDLNNEILNLDKQIYDIVKPWIGEKTNLDECTIEKNIFVFWWDGLNKAPEIVKSCIESVRRMHQGCEVIVIDKNNFEQYTNINTEILQGFKDDKISIQTFSDILRFNLLKENGGVWIDATIFFLKEFSLLDDLENKPISSLEFCSSGSFFEYEDKKCSWSGFFFASRKNSVFVNVMNDIFEKYYLKYHKYPLYFFIDAALMICKKYRIDDDALSKTKKSWGDMFFLARVLNEKSTNSGVYLASVVPQKLAWFADIESKNVDSYYNVLLTVNGEHDRNI